MSWYQDGYDRGYNDGSEGKENLASNVYLINIFFPTTEDEDEFLEGYREGYEEGKANRDEEEPSE